MTYAAYKCNLIYPINLYCQLSKFVAKFSNFSHYPSNFFFHKHLATNLAIVLIYLVTFSNFW